MTSKTITFDGEKYKLVPVEEKQERKTGWERVEKNDKYYFCDYFLGSGWNFHFDDLYDEKSFRNGNYRNDRELNENICRAIRLCLKMLQWQALNDEAVDFSDRNKNKYYLYFDFDTNLIEISFNACCYSMNIYFSSKEKAEEALEVFYDELIWYYTEFYRRLDEKR